jgi:periplasmic copper chaperone A
MALPALAEVTASDAWVRGTVPAQKTTAAYVSLKSTQGARVVEVRTKAAARAEIHSSEMHEGVMVMHAMEGFRLPAGKTVRLQPGGYHIMLLDLVKPLVAGDKVTLTLVVEEGKRRSSLDVVADVRPLGR